MVSKKFATNESVVYTQLVFVKSVNYEYEYKVSKVYSIFLATSNQTISYLCIRYDGT